MEVAVKLAQVLGVPLDYLMDNLNVLLDRELMDKVVDIQILSEEDKKCIMYSIDGLIQHAKTRQADKK